MIYSRIQSNHSTFHFVYSSHLLYKTNIKQIILSISDEKGPYDLSLKNRPLKEANCAIKTQFSEINKSKEINNLSFNSYINAQYRGVSLYTPQSSAAKCLSPQDLSPNSKLNGDRIKPAFTPLEPLNTNHNTSPSPPLVARSFQMPNYLPFGFPGYPCFGYNENKHLVTSSYSYQSSAKQHLDYPISPPQTPISRSERLSIDDNRRTLSPEYRPQYMGLNWNDHSVKSVIPSGSLIISSPTPSLNGSDDSGRGSVHSRESGISTEIKFKDNDNRVPKSRKGNGSEVNGQRYQCSDCNKSYSTYSGLSKHKEFHCTTQSKKAFSCKHCDKVYVSLGALKMHIRTHTLPCKCKLCGKAFSRPWLLQGHIRTHTGEKPFACPHCSRAFADRSNLRAHLQTHSDVKKYSCKSCSKTFSRMSLLLKHEDGGCVNTRLQ